MRSMAEGLREIRSSPAALWAASSPYRRGVDPVSPSHFIDQLSLPSNNAL
jgi:hypothetical protein